MREHYLLRKPIVDNTLVSISLSIILYIDWKFFRHLETERWRGVYIFCLEVTVFSMKKNKWIFQYMYCFFFHFCMIKSIHNKHVIYRTVYTPVHSSKNHNLYALRGSRARRVDSSLYYISSIHLKWIMIIVSSIYSVNLHVNTQKQTGHQKTIE